MVLFNSGDFMKFLSILLLVAFMFTLPFTVNADEENIVSPTDENINYVGRWILDDKGKMAGSYECYLSLRFTGTSIALNKGFSGGMFYRIDGGEYQRQNTKALAKNLEEGEHLLEIVATAQKAFPKINGFILDKGAVTLPYEEKPLIEFLGDSIMEGYIVNADKSSNNSVLNSYGHKTAEILGFYRNIIAYGGITMSPGYGNPDNQGMVNRYKLVREYSPEEPISPNWDTAQFIPDYLVINLGTNDGGVSGPEFKMWYITFLSYLETTYPDAKIFMMAPFNGKHHDDILDVYEGFKKNANIYLIDSYLWNVPGGGDNLHPDGSGHDMAADLLSKEIIKLLSAPAEPEITPAPEATDAVQGESNIDSPTPTPEDKDGNKTNWLPIIIACGAAVVAVITSVIIILTVKKKKAN